MNAAPAGIALRLIAQFARGQGSTGMADAMVNAVRRIDLSWVRIEIGLLVGALLLGA